MWSAMQTGARLWRALWQARGGAAGGRGLKVVSALQRRCNKCRIVKRGKKLYVLCEHNPRHKQRQGKGGAVYRRT